MQVVSNISEMRGKRYGEEEIGGWGGGNFWNFQIITANAAKQAAIVACAI